MPEQNQPNHEKPQKPPLYIVKGFRSIFKRCQNDIANRITREFKLQTAEPPYWSIINMIEPASELENDLIADVVVNGDVLHVTEFGTTIGRRYRGTFNVFDPQIRFMSRDHAVLKRDREGRLSITDVSTFGTWINDCKIEKEQEYCIRPTDKISLGSPSGPFLNIIARRGKDCGTNFVPNPLPPVRYLPPIQSLPPVQTSSK